LGGLALGAGQEQFVGVGHQGAVITAGMIDEGVEEPRGDEARIAGLLERVFQTGGEVVTGSGLEEELDAQTAVEWEQLDFPQAFLQATIASEDDREDHAGIEVGTREEAQLIEHVGADVLRLVDEQYGTKQRGVDVGEPCVTQGLGAGPWPISR